MKKNLSIFFCICLFGLFPKVYSINVTLQATSLSICEGACTQIKAHVTGANGAVTFTWSPATYLTGANDSIKTACPVSTITYKLVVEDAVSNKDSATITITVKPNPTANFTFSPNNVCAGTAVSFTNTSTGGNTYLWNFGDGTTSGTASPSHSFPAVTGNSTNQYIVKLVITNSLTGCKDSITKTVTIKQLPSTALTELSNFNNCAYSSSSNQSFTINVLNASTTNNTSYSITWGDGTPDFTATSFTTVNHTYNFQGQYSLVFQVTGANGCINTHTYQVTNISNPAISFGNPGNTQGCGPKNLCFPISDYSNNYSSTTYVVDFGDGSPKVYLSHPPPDTICHTYTKSSCGHSGVGCTNCFVATITAKNACDSTLTTTNNIKVYTTPDASLSGPQSGCTNQTLTFSNTTTPGYDNYCNSSAFYTWNFGDGSQPVLVGNTSSQSHSYSAPGNYVITLLVQNYCGTDSIKKNVCINPLPVAKFGYSDSVFCKPETVYFTNLSSVQNVCGNTTYTWNITCINDSCNNPGCGGYTYVNGTNNTSVNPVVYFTQPGKYVMTLTASNGCNPPGTYSKTIRVQSKPNVILSGIPAYICQGASITPTITFKKCYGNNISFLWTLPGGSITSSTSQNPGTITYNTPGTYPISIKVTNECGDTTISSSILVNATPKVNQVNNISVCPATLINIGNFTSTPSGATFTWTNNNTSIGIGASGSGNIASWNAPSNNTGANITGTITVTPLLNNCYGPPMSFTVTIYPTPAVTANSPTICNGNSANITASGASSYLWSNGFTTNVITVSPSSTTTYSVTGTDTITGCSKTVTSTVTVNPLPVVNAGPSVSACNQPVPITLTGYSPAGGTWSGTGVTSNGVFTPATLGNFTLTYSYTNPTTGCSNSDTMTVSVIAPQIANAGTGFNICINTSPVTLTGYSPAGGTWSGAGISGNTFNPATAGAGNFILTYTFGAGTCLSSDTIKVTVYSLPVITVNSATICAGQSSTLTANGADTYLWSNNSVTNYITVTPVTNSTYTVTGTDTTTGCKNTATSTVTVNPLPVISASPSQTSVCSGTSISILLSSTVAGTIYNWTVNAPAGITGASNGNGSQIQQTLTSTLNIPDTVLYTITPVASGCQGSPIDVTVIVNSKPVITISPASQTMCAGDISSAIILTSSANSTTYSWTATAPANITGYQNTGNGNIQAMQLNNLSLSTGTITYVINSNAFGCPGNPGQATITVNPGPSVSNTPLSQYICSGQTSNQVVLTSGVPNTTFSWAVTSSGAITGFTPGGTNIIPSQTLYNSGNTTDTVIYHITTSANSGVLCPGQSSDYLIIVHPLPAASFTASSTTGCAPFTVLFTNQSTPAGLIYNWDFGNGQYSNLQNPTYTYTNTGIIDSVFQVTLTVTDSGSACAANVTQQTITVHPGAVNASFSIDNSSGCAPLTVNFTNTSTGGTGYFWDFDDGNTSVSQNATHTYTLPGQYVVSLVVNNGCGYDTAYSSVITVHPVITPVVTFNNNVCTYEPINFTNTAPGITSFLWNFGDGSPTSILPNPSHLYNNPGTYQVTLTAANQYNCTATITLTANVKFTPEALFTTSANEGCSPLSIQFHNSTDSLTYNSYLWNFGNGNSSTLTTPFTQIYTNINNCKDTSFSIILIANNSNCLDTFTSNITVHPVPISDFTSYDSTYCTFLMPANIHFNQQSICAQNYQWLSGNLQVSSIQDPDIYFPYPATHYVSLIASNNFQCKDTTTKKFIVYPNWEFLVGLNPTKGCEPLGVNFQALLDSLTYQWNFGDNSTSTQAHSFHLYLNDGIYTVQIYASGNGGCVDSLIMNDTIKVWPKADANFTSTNLNYTPPNDGTFLFTNYSQDASIFSWDFGDGTFFNGWDTVHRYQTNNYYDVILIANNSYNCPDTTMERIYFDGLYGLYIPNAFCPTSSNPLIQNFQPVGIGLKTYHIEVYDTWGNRVWESSSIDQEGKPTEYWDGTTAGGDIMPMDAYVWKASATFINGTEWAGMQYGNNIPKRYGTVTIIK